MACGWWNIAQPRKVAGRVGMIFNLMRWDEPELGYMHIYDGFEGKGYAYQKRPLPRGATRPGISALTA